MNNLGRRSSPPSRKRVQQTVSVESRAVHNQLERERRKLMTQTIKDFVEVLPRDKHGRKDKTSILEAVVNFFDVVYDNVTNIHELEQDFKRCGERSSRNKRPAAETVNSFSQQNSCHEPVTKYALVDMRTFDIFSALEDDTKARNILGSSTVITNSEAFELMMNKTIEKSPVFHFGPYVDPPSANVFSEVDFFVPATARPRI